MSDQHNIFTNPSTEESGSLDKLVGEGKKYRTVEDLAKAVEHGQAHIATLEAEAEQWRQGIRTQVEQQRQQNDQGRQMQPPEAPQPSGQHEDQSNLDDRIREAIETRERESRLTQNINEVSERVAAHYGDAKKANEAIKAKANELGVSIEFLMDVAAKSPKAFYAQIGLDAAPRQAPAPRGTVNPEALRTANPTQATPGTYAYYEEMRKANSRLYNSPRIQLEMHEQAMKNPNFFSA